MALSTGRLRSNRVIRPPMKPESAPLNRTSTAESLTPALARTCFSGTPVQEAVPSAPVSHGVPGGLGFILLRPFPAQSIVVTTALLRILIIAARDRRSGFSTSPLTFTLHLEASTFGTGTWLR